MTEIVAIGEILVEVMATEPDQGFRMPGLFAAPYPSGAPAIFADQAARMGASTAMIGCVGPDEFGAGVLDRLRASGVDVRGVTRAADVATGVAFVSYRRDGSRDFIFHLGNSAAGRLRAADIDPHLFDGCRFVHVMGTSLVSDELDAAVAHAVALAMRAGGKLSFDPNVRPELLRRPGMSERIRDLAARAHVLLPSEADLAHLHPGVPRDTAVRRLLDDGAACVFLKLGAEGSIYYDRDRQIATPAYRVAEIDPTGAGDCAGATFMAGLVGGLDIGTVLRRANAAGALAVTRRGPMEGNSGPAELDAFIRSHGAP